MVAGPLGVPGVGLGLTPVGVTSLRARAAMPWTGRMTQAAPVTPPRGGQSAGQHGERVHRMLVAGRRLPPRHFERHALSRKIDW